MIKSTINEAPMIEISNQSEIDITSLQFTTDMQGLMKPQQEQQIVALADPTDPDKKYYFSCRELTPAEKTVIWETMIPDPDLRQAISDPDMPADEQTETINQGMTQEQQIARTIDAQSKALSLCVSFLTPDPVQMTEDQARNMYEDARSKLYDVVSGRKANVVWQFPKVSTN